MPWAVTFTDARRSAGSILIVDDDPAIVGFLELALADEGYEVRSAGNGRDALDKVGEHSPDLILLDMNMPIMNGWEFCEQLPQHASKAIPIVVMTAARDASARSREVGAQAFLGKPFNLEHMFRTIRDLLPSS